MSNIHILGIRHHGPGSARSVLSYLNKFEFDLICVEGPSDAQEMIADFKGHLIELPAALMAMKPESKDTVVFPFAEFSPEYQAIHYGLSHQIEVRWIDVPQAMAYNMSHLDGEGKKIDIFSEMALTFGYPDAERWWEVTFEQGIELEERFTSILSIMEDIRSSQGHEKSSHLIREAYMREKLRKAQKEGFKNIAVIVGAWHAPTLNLNNYASKEDRSLFEPISRSKIQYYWVPWSYHKLSFSSGYQSGIHSALWYEFLFQSKESAETHWLSYISQKLRHRLSLSPAHVLEATMLAKNLAFVRNLPIPGLNELYDSMITVFFQGKDPGLEPWFQSILSGSRVGRISPGASELPIQEDFRRQLKTYRLSSLWGKEEIKERKLDLRKDKHLEISRLLYRLLLLDIPWGKEQLPDFNPLGNFHEIWELEWQPEFDIRIIEEGIWGNTIYSAVQSKVLHKIQTADIRQLAHFLEYSIKANLDETIVKIANKILSVATISNDAELILKAIPPLMSAYRYGDIRQTDNSDLSKILDRLFPRALIHLPALLYHIDYPAAVKFKSVIYQIDHLLVAHQNPEFTGLWLKTLQKLIDNKFIHSLIKGYVYKLLLQKKNLNIIQAAEGIQFELSRIQDSKNAAYLLEGLLKENANLVIQFEDMRGLINQWILHFSDQEFVHYLPLIRRIFVEYSQAEKQNILDRIIYPKLSKQYDEEKIEPKRIALFIDWLNV